MDRVRGPWVLLRTRNSTRIGWVRFAGRPDSGHWHRRRRACLRWSLYFEEWMDFGRLDGVSTLRFARGFDGHGNGTVSGNGGALPLSVDTVSVAGSVGCGDSGSSGGKVHRGLSRWLTFVFVDEIRSEPFESRMDLAAQTSGRPSGAHRANF